MQLLPHYTHIVNPKLKHTYLSFDDEGTLVIRSPKVSRNYIERLLLKKSAWINRSREKLLQKKGKRLQFRGEEKLYFLGQPYALDLVPRDKAGTTLAFDNRQQFRLYYRQYDTARFQAHVDRFYRKEAEAFIPPLVEKYAQQMALSPSGIRFRKTKRQWGSCSGKDILSFNTMLMKLPSEAIEYVIVHELAHIRHKHHQKAFWELVGKHIPDYQRKIAILKSYTTY